MKCKHLNGASRSEAVQFKPPVKRLTPVTQIKLDENTMHCIKMREIEFRFWFKETKKMVYSSVFSSNLKLMTWTGNIYREGKLLDAVPLQYTENKYKGDKIFHKDIVLVEGHYDGDTKVERQLGVVEWEEDGWYILNKNGEGLCSLFDFVNNYGGAIKGNIYENPELLA